MFGCLFRTFLLAIAVGAVVLLFEFRFDDGELRVKARFWGGDAREVVEKPAQKAKKAAKSAAEELPPVEEYPEDSREKLEQLISEETE